MSSISIFQFEQRETKQAAVLEMYNIKFYTCYTIDSSTVGING